MITLFKRHPALAYGLLLAGCLCASSGAATYARGALPPDSMISADSLPAAYQDTSIPSIPMPDEDAWWKRFDDAALSSLIDAAIRNNYDLRAAMRRIEVSRQMLRATYSAYYPTLGIYAGYDLNKESDREKLPYVKEHDNSSFNLGATMSWEVDIFGRVARKAKAGKATVNVSRLEYEAMMLSVAAEVAQDYADMRMYEQQLEIANRHLASQTEMLKIVESRYDAGLVSKLDVAQAKNTLNTTRLMIPSLQSGVITSRNALATLCAIPESDIDAIVANGNTLQLLPPPGVGSPADLVRRRPDVVEAEQQIEVLAAQLGVARQDWLPTLTVNASVETSAHSFGDLFGFRSLTYSVTPQLSWTLFDGFQRDAAIAEAKANMEAYVDTYNMTLLTAVQEVNNALAAYNASVSELQLYKEVISDSEEVLSLSEERYKLGLTDFSDVATAQISLLSQETSFASSQAGCLANLVSLYKALGGGWQQ